MGLHCFPIKIQLLRAAVKEEKVSCSLEQFSPVQTFALDWRRTVHRMNLFVSAHHRQHRFSSSDVSQRFEVR